MISKILNTFVIVIMNAIKDNQLRLLISWIKYMNTTISHRCIIAINSVIALHSKQKRIKINI